MKKLIIPLSFTFFLITPLLASIIEQDNRTFHFPEPGKTYTSADRGFAKYQVNSDLQGTRRIALTFDDGPDYNLTPKVLDALKEYGVHATFFVLKKNITSKTLPIIYRMIQEGHTVGSHGIEHDDATKETKAEYYKDLKTSLVNLENIYEQVGVKKEQAYYRFPFGNYAKRSDYHHMNLMKEISQELYGENCINFVFWDIDTSDWVSTMKPEQIVQTVFAHIDGGLGFTFTKINKRWDKKPEYFQKQGGGVVLMHDIHPQTVAAVPLILEKARNEGVEIVPLSADHHFSYDGKTCRMDQRFISE